MSSSHQPFLYLLENRATQQVKGTKIQSLDMNMKQEREPLSWTHV